MTDRLEQIKARMEAATPGPWESQIPNLVVAPDSPEGWWGEVADLSGTYFHRQEEDLEFIAHSIADVEWLVSEVERLRLAVNQTLDYLESDHDLDSRQEVVAFANNQLEHVDTREES